MLSSNQILSEPGVKSVMESMLPELGVVANTKDGGASGGRLDGRADVEIFDGADLDGGHGK